ncbi:hemolysin family protein [Bacillaceae bacterium]
MSDPVPILINLFLVLLLVLLNGFFVAAEFAMVKVRNTRIEELVMNGNVRAKFAQTLVQNLDAYLSACQLGITLASLGLGWIGEPAIARMIEPILANFGLGPTVIHTIAFVIAFSIITFLHIVLGELAPKSLAIQKAEGTTLWTAVPLIAFYKMMYPFIWFLNGTANWMLRKIGIEPASEHAAAHTEEEIRILMKQSHESGHIDNTELMLMDNIFEFTERNAREIMVPRTEMVCLYSQLSYQENLEIALREKHTRFPVCDPDKDNIIGFIHIKDLMALSLKEETKDLKGIIRRVIKVPESIPISNLLKILQKNRTQLAIVIDEFGGTAGLVTIEDILEEIVGEIQDEFDEERAAIEAKPDGTYSVDGRILIEDFNQYFDLDLNSEDFDTLGGWIYSRVELPPKVGQKIFYGDYEFTITEVKDLRADRIAVRKKASEPSLLQEKKTG